MAAKFFVILFCVALTQARLVRRDAPAASPSATTVLQDIEKHAAEFQKTFSEQLNALVNSRNTQELNKALKESSDTALQKASELSNSLQAVVNEASGNVKQVLEQGISNLQASVQQLRQQHPEVDQQATALKDHLQASVSTASQHVQKLAQDLAANIDKTNEKLAPQVRAVVDDFIKNAQEVQKKLHEAATHPQQ